MKSEQQIIAEYQIRAMGMQAENNQRMATDSSMAYTQEYFEELIDNMNFELDKLRNEKDN
jgi:hypothetical protein